MLTDSQSQIFECTTDESSDRNTPESSVENTVSSDDICKNDNKIGMQKSSSSLDCDSRPELLSGTTSSTSTVPTISSLQQYSQPKF